MAGFEVIPEDGLIRQLVGPLQDFSVIAADTPALLDDVYALRHRVYCGENAYEDPAAFPDGRERDRYDDYSRHAVLTYRPTATSIGTVRLVMPKTPDQHLPIEEVLATTEGAVLRALKGRTAEVSRYAISKQFRRRDGEDQYPDVAHEFQSSRSAARRMLPQLTLGLMKAVLGFCIEDSVDTLCAVMAPALIRLLRGFGLRFEPLGLCVTFHGTRQPCLASVNGLLRGLETEQPAFFDVVSTGLDNSRDVHGTMARRQRGEN